MPTVATWEFSSRDEAEKAMVKIHWEFGSPSAYQSGNLIEIDTECKDIAKSAQICKATAKIQNLRYLSKPKVSLISYYK